YIAFNYKVKEFQDKRVRQALAHAINTKAIADALHGGTGLVATQFQPPSLCGDTRELKDFEYGPARPRELLRQAGFAAPLPAVRGRARGLVCEHRACRSPPARPEADNSGGAGEALSTGRADAARRRGAALHRQQPAPARLLEASEGVRAPPDRIGVLQHGGGP